MVFAMLIHASILHQVCLTDVGTQALSETLLTYAALLFPSAAGSLPLVSKGTHVIIPLVDSLEDERWEAKVVEQSGNKIKLSVNSPASAVCGLYGLTVTTGSSRGEATSAHARSKNVVMLFNPWCEGGFGRWGVEGIEGRFLEKNEEREGRKAALRQTCGMICTEPGDFFFFS